MEHPGKSDSFSSLKSKTKRTNKNDGVLCWAKLLLMSLHSALVCLLLLLLLLRYAGMKIASNQSLEGEIGMIFIYFGGLFVFCAGAFFDVV